MTGTKKPRKSVLDKIKEAARAVQEAPSRARKALVQKFDDLVDTPAEKALAEQVVALEASQAASDQANKDLREANAQLETQLSTHKRLLREEAAARNVAEKNAATLMNRAKEQATTIRHWQVAFAVMATLAVLATAWVFLPQ